MRGMDLALARFATGTADDVYATMPGAEVGAVLATALDAADPGTRRVALAVIAQAVAAVCDDEDRGVLPDATATWLYELTATLPAWRPALLARLDDDDDGCVHAAIAALHALAVADRDGLVRGRDHAARRAALGALIDAATPRLASALATDTAPVRAAAAAALGDTRPGNAGVEAALEAALRDDDARVRRAAVAARLERAADAKVDAVVALVGDPDREVAALATAHAARCGDARATDAVIAALRPGPGAPAAVDAARRLGSPATVPALLDLLTDTHDPAQLAAIARALVEHADARCVAPLVALLSRKDTAAAFAAIALARAGATDAADALAATLAPRGPRPTRYLDMQAAALRALGALGGPTHLATIEATFARPGHDHALRVPALEALVRLDTPGVRPYLLQALPERGDMALVAIRGLGRCGDPADLPLLRRTLDATSPYLCEAAAISLATLERSADALAALEDTLVTGLHRTPDAVLATAVAWRALLDANPDAFALRPRFAAAARASLDASVARHRDAGDGDAIGEALIDAVAFEAGAAVDALHD